MEKRVGNTVKKGLMSLLFPVMSIVVALLLGALILALMGYDVGLAYGSLFQGAFGNVRAFGNTLQQMTPLLFCAISYSIAYRCGLINLGAEGQLYIGAICGALAGAHIHGLPSAIHIPIVLICGFAGGAVMGLIVGALKMKFGASELITTIMLNYIALEFTKFCCNNPPFRDATQGAAPRMPTVLESAKLPVILPGTTLRLGIVLALIGCLVYYFFMWKTTRGYEMRVIGMNPNAGRYSGMNIHSNSILAMFIAGGFAGLGGAIEIIGRQFYVTDAFSKNYGFSGIAVALLGNTHPLGMVFSGVLFGGLNAGGNTMQTLAGVPDASIYMLQGIIILFAVSRELFGWFAKIGRHIKALFTRKREEA